VAVLVHKTFEVLYPLVKYTKCLELCVLTQWMTAGTDDGSNVKHAVLVALPNMHLVTIASRRHTYLGGAPLGHSVQVEAPVTGLYVPTGQLRHCRTALHFGWHSTTANAIVIEQPVQMRIPCTNEEKVENIRRIGDS
jgi:hypothetical protein